MARSLACELGRKGIVSLMSSHPSAAQILTVETQRVNSLSPGHVRTNLTEKFLEENPGQEEKVNKFFIL